MRILPLLSLVVVVRSCQRFKTWGRVVVVAGVFVLQGTVAMVYSGVPIHEEILLRASDPPVGWRVNVFLTNAMIVFGLVLVFVSLLVNALLSVYHSQQELAVAHEQLREYAARVENQATLQERNRIAREIHDSLGHALTAQAILLENALLYLPSQANQSRDYLTSAKDSAYQALQDVSRSVSALRHGPLHGESLTTAVPVLVNELCRSARLRSECWVDLPDSLPDEIKLALFRIVQEALTNAVKHSHATAVQVKLGAKRSRMHLQVLDNGQGFDPSKNTSGFGLRGMRERATALGGICQLWSAPGAGCRISVMLPLSKAIDHPA
jgi:signal transduction histidine kinase